MFYELSHISQNGYFKKIYVENFAFPPHVHNCFELVVCLDGKADITVGGKNYRPQKGEAVLVFPHELHAFSPCEGKYLICIFSPSLVSAFYGSRVSKKPSDHLFAPAPELVKALDETAEGGSTCRKKGLLYLVCDTFNATAQYSENESKSLLEKIFIYVGKNFTENCTLKTVAENVGYNPSYVSRYFKRCVGINLCDYINMVRLGNVCYLYENRNETILNCAMESGFDSLRTFNRNFKKFYGKSPREYLGTTKNL